MRDRFHLVIPLAISAILVGACTGAGGATAPSASTQPSTGTYDLLPVVVSSEQYVGTDRFLFSFLDAKTNSPASAPDRSASVAVYPTSKGPAAATTGDGTFMWIIPGTAGVYRTTLSFSEAGPWTALFTTAAPGHPSETIPFEFDVQPSPSAVQVGEAAPSVKTPTLADVGGDVAQISSDKSPDPAFYKVSVDQALAAHDPFVLVFATPAFCRSGACGPLLDTVKSVAASYPSVTFINVEPYKLKMTDGTLQPVLDANGQLIPVDATNAYGILSEPWIFVVDSTGTITASIEGATDLAELKAALDPIANK
jgi:hypothetical protein